MNNLYICIGIDIDNYMKPPKAVYIIRRTNPLSKPHYPTYFYYQDYSLQSWNWSRHSKDAFWYYSYTEADHDRKNIPDSYVECINSIGFADIGKNLIVF